jgi:hypothetical protein
MHLNPVLMAGAFLPLPSPESYCGIDRWGNKKEGSNGDFYPVF